MELIGTCLIKGGLIAPDHNQKVIVNIHLIINETKSCLLRKEGEIYNY